MVETLSRPIIETGRSSTAVKEAQTVIDRQGKGRVIGAINIVASIQRGIIKKHGYTDYAGNEHEGLYLRPDEIIGELENSWPILAKTGISTIDQTEDGAEKWISRRKALVLLSTANHIKESQVKALFIKGGLTEKRFHRALEPIEGVKLAVMSELAPERFYLLVRNLRQK